MKFDFDLVKFKNKYGIGGTILLLAAPVLGVGALALGVSALLGLFLPAVITIIPAFAANMIWNICFSASIPFLFIGCITAICEKAYSSKKAKQTKSSVANEPIAQPSEVTKTTADIESKATGKNKPDNSGWMPGFGRLFGADKAKDTTLPAQPESTNSGRVDAPR